MDVNTYAVRCQKDIVLYVNTQAPDGYIELYDIDFCLPKDDRCNCRRKRHKKITSKRMDENNVVSLRSVECAGVCGGGGGGRGCVLGRAN